MLVFQREGGRTTRRPAVDTPATLRGPGTARNSRAPGACANESSHARLCTCAVCSRSLCHFPFPPYLDFFAVKLALLIAFFLSQRCCGAERGRSPIIRTAKVSACCVCLCACAGGCVCVLFPSMLTMLDNAPCLDCVV